MPAEVQNFTLATLYVGDLDPSVSESHICEKFHEDPNLVGTIMSIRICRDVITRRSLRYGYINFRTAEDAERALDMMNHEMINGHPMRLMWSQRDPAIRKSGIGNIFVKNLECSIDNKIMYDTFAAYGNILSCKVALDENNRSKGYGFVQYETKEQAERSIEKVNGMLLNGRKVYVGHFIPQKERIRSLVKANDFTNIYIKNFEGMTEEALRKLFEKFGPITKCTVMTDGDGKSKGFGFVTFRNSENGKRAVEEMHGHELAEGKALYVARAQKKIERQEELRNKHRALKQELMISTEGSNLYVKNLEDGTDDAALRKKFEPYGTITSAKVMKDENGCSKGFGFVCYSDPEEATKAVSQLNGCTSGTRTLFVALAERKEARQLLLRAQYQARLNQQIPSPPYQFQTTPFLVPIVQQRPQFYGPVSQISHTNPPRPGQVAMARPAAPQNMANGNGAVPHYLNGNGAVTHYPNGNGAVPHSLNGNGAVTHYPNGNGAVPYNSNGTWIIPHYANANWPVPNHGTGPYQVYGNITPQLNQTAPVPATRQLNNARTNFRIETQGRPVVHQNNGVIMQAQPPAASFSFPQPQPHQAIQIQCPVPLAVLESQQQKQQLVVQLYPIVQTMSPENLVGKVVEMLLELDSAELGYFLENRDSLNLRVQEVVKMLTKCHNQAPAYEDQSQGPNEE